MDKRQLLNIMRRQELEIKKLTSEKDKLTKHLTESVPDSNIIKSEQSELSEQSEQSELIVKNVSDIYLKNISLLKEKYIEEESVRTETKHDIKKVIASTLKNLIVIASAAILLVNLLISVLTVSRSSMNPILQDGDAVIAIRWVSIKPGDVVSFYYNNQILLRRVIAKAGDWVNIEEDGTVYVNNEILDEPYVTEKSLGVCDIELPYQVPDGSIFVMGDQRTKSADSRLREIGPVSKENIVGKVFLRIWPPSRIGLPE